MGLLLQLLRIFFRDRVGDEIRVVPRILGYHPIPDELRQRVVENALAYMAFAHLRVGFDPLGLKWNFERHGRFSPYLELCGGTLFTDHNVPTGTNTVNFTDHARTRRAHPRREALTAWA